MLRDAITHLHLYIPVYAQAENGETGDGLWARFDGCRVAEHGHLRQNMSSPVRNRSRCLPERRCFQCRLCSQCCAMSSLHELHIRLCKQALWQALLGKCRCEAAVYIVHAWTRRNPSSAAYLPRVARPPVPRSVRHHSSPKNASLSRQLPGVPQIAEPSDFCPPLSSENGRSSAKPTFAPQQTLLRIS